MSVPASRHLIIPFTAKGWSDHSLDGPASLSANGWDGRFVVYGKEPPSRLISYLSCSNHLRDPNPLSVYGLAESLTKEGGECVVMDQSCFVTAPIDRVLAMAKGKLVCGTGPDPLPTYRTRLSDHGMPDEVFGHNLRKVQLILRSILASQGRRYSAGFLAGDGPAWKSFMDFVRLCDESGICSAVGDSWEALVNLYAHSVPSGVEVLGREDYAQVDSTWGRGRYSLIGNRTAGGVRFRDIFPAEFAAESARYEGKPAKRVLGRPLMRVSRVARHLKYR